MSITFSNISVSPYKFEHISDLRIEKSANEHDTLFISGIVPEKELDKYIETMDGKTLISVSVKTDKKTEVVFKGIVTTSHIDAAMSVRKMEIEAKSTSYMFDIQKKSRTFESGKTYKQVIDEIVADYKNNKPDLDLKIDGGKALDTMLIQYMETDWEFLKRIASHFNDVLLVDSLDKKPRVYVGMPKERVEKIDEDKVAYTVRKDLLGFREKSENSVKNLDENNFIRYEIDLRKNMKLESVVNFKGRKFNIAGVKSRMKDGFLMNRYIMGEKDGFKVRRVRNRLLDGVTLKGVVKEVDKDMVKVNITFKEHEKGNDKEKSKVHLMPYGTVYSTQSGSGWYFMPEKDDMVKVHIPDGEEKNIYASSSTSPSPEDKKNERRADPTIKSLSNVQGKEVKLTPGGIDIISNGETVLRLTDDGGIEITSGKKIIMDAKEDIYINSGEKLMISGDKEINLKQGPAKINIKNDITMEGKQINIK